MYLRDVVYCRTVIRETHREVGSVPAHQDMVYRSINVHWKERHWNEKSKPPAQFSGLVEQKTRRTCAFKFSRETDKTHLLHDPGREYLSYRPRHEELSYACEHKEDRQASLVHE